MKTILFLTGTRADFGKLKSLIEECISKSDIKVIIVVTGMHLIKKFGYTVKEVKKVNARIITFPNHLTSYKMEICLSETIKGLSKVIDKICPNLIVVHGDRVETLAGAMVGSLRNILVAHIEGGEKSGSVDESLRHSISKLSHVHLVGNAEAKKRLIQMGEKKNSIHIIGSPDLDIIVKKNLPPLSEVKKYYSINFHKYSIAMLHPVTTEIIETAKNTEIFVESLIKSDKDYVVIYPNNDYGYEEILKKYQKLSSNNKFILLPSMRFEYFITLLKNSDFIIGNSSTGIKESPFLGVPSINIGSRQNERTISQLILNSNFDTATILNKINKV